MCMFVCVCLYVCIFVFQLVHMICAQELSHASCENTAVLVCKSASVCMCVCESERERVRENVCVKRVRCQVYPLIDPTWE